MIFTDETVFTGLHYRMNLETGLKEAKLMDGTDGTEYFKLINKYLNKKLIESLEVPRVDNDKTQEKEELRDENSNVAIVPVDTDNNKDVNTNILHNDAIDKIQKKVKDFKKDQKDSSDGSFLNDVKNLDDSHFKDHRVKALEEAMLEVGSYLITINCDF